MYSCLCWHFTFVLMKLGRNPTMVRSSVKYDTMWLEMLSSVRNPLWLDLQRSKASKREPNRHVRKVIWCYHNTAFVVLTEVLARCTSSIEFDLRQSRNQWTPVQNESEFYDIDTFPGIEKLLPQFHATENCVSTINPAEWHRFGTRWDSKTVMKMKTEAVGVNISIATPSVS